MPHALTATEDNHIRMAMLRHALMDAMFCESKSRAERMPTVAVIGFEEYLPLKMEILGSSAELINRGPGGLTYFGCCGQFPESHIQMMTQIGVESFFWNGILVLCARSQARGTIFL